MPYNEHFRSQVLLVINELRSINGKQYHRKSHTLDMIIQKYQQEMTTKYNILGNVILANMNKHISEIFTQINDNSSYEILEFVLSIIKWYFKTIIKRKTKKNDINTDSNTQIDIQTPNQATMVSLPDYTIPEIKELWKIMQ